MITITDATELNCYIENDTVGPCSVCFQDVKITYLLFDQMWVAFPADIKTLLLELDSRLQKEN